jgi:hypothetical protein
MFYMQRALLSFQLFSFWTWNIKKITLNIDNNNNAYDDDNDYDNNDGSLQLQQQQQQQNSSNKAPPQ